MRNVNDSDRLGIEWVIIICKPSGSALGQLGTIFIMFVKATNLSIFILFTLITNIKTWLELLWITNNSDLSIFHWKSFLHFEVGTYITEWSEKNAEKAYQDIKARKSIGPASITVFLFTTLTKVQSLRQSRPVIL